MKISQDALAERLGMTRVWLSYLENGQREVTELYQLKIRELENQVYAPHLKSGDLMARVEEGRELQSGGVASRLPLEKRMPSRADCEDYLQRILDAAEAEGSPENIPAIFHRLKKQFPADEWFPPAKENTL